MRPSLIRHACLAAAVLIPANVAARQVQPPPDSVVPLTPVHVRALLPAVVTSSPAAATVLDRTQLARIRPHTLHEVLGLRAIPRVRPYTTGIPHERKLSVYGLQEMGSRFRQAMDVACVTPRELAERMGIHEQRIKQARLDSESTGYRPPPEGWEAAVLELARDRRGAIEQLLAELDGGGGE